MSIFLLLFLVHLTTAYIPAVPTNDTSLPVFNTSSLSSFALRWQQQGHQPMGLYSTAVSYQLAGDGSDGVTQGAIVHFTEATAADNLTTSTPWIAFISCDNNATNASMEDDIFTLAQERGAVSALLYSSYSQACLINSEYLSPEFDKLIDVFATTSQKTAGLIESQFEQVNTSFYYYNAALLNASALLVNESMADMALDQPAYLVALLQASNATGNATAPDTPSSSGSSSGGGGTPNTGLAMIILYAITGCVSVLFCIVILSGAIRAIRHPERYGPRADPGYMGGLPPQTRTAGLARAILDTFPVIKFAGRGEEVEMGSAAKGGSLEGGELGVGVGASGSGGSTPTDRKLVGTGEGEVASPLDTSFLADADLAPALQFARSVSPSSSRPLDAPFTPALPSQTPTSTSATSTSTSTSTANPIPNSNTPEAPLLGHTTCPICLSPFTEGDSLRLLPCAGRHTFHQECVDPWLLTLATSCPLCREDFDPWHARARDGGAGSEGEGEAEDGDGEGEGAGEYLELPVPESPRREREGRLGRLFGRREQREGRRERERERERERGRGNEWTGSVGNEWIGSVGMGAGGEEMVLPPHPLA
ncbi:hypothetical protein DACRYDRAFT_114697 [Dacryopinax primogenitus]|uniref:RING-type domain-containing protein n=1 Tax=Dacryopinax primogenitus (strain DJM 731) TaxID=1858805 RepID=M5GFR3_DACPD|nr:uncharacterized protein DACRYDRAFT_114697 [Dacryopinax primogenitus]EJU04353.1 hypothetical protein DACRYDRAFT_114697 [Dacryopinax primogenitus]